MDENARKFSEYAKKWLDSKALGNKTTTKSRYMTIINHHLNPVFGDRSIDEITEADIRDYLQNLSKEKKYNTVHAIAIVLKSILCDEYEDEPARKIRLRCFNLKKEKTRIEPLKISEAKKFNRQLIQSESTRDIAMLIALNAGLRIGEICALRWKDIDFNMGAVRVSHTVQRIYEKNGDNVTKLELLPPKTQDSVRIVPISARILDKLREMKTDDGNFIITQKNTPLDPRLLDRSFAIRCKEIIGRKIRFHDLRHTFATLAISAGSDVKSVSEILGHKDVSTTLGIYRQVSFDDKMKVLRKLNKTVGF